MRPNWEKALARCRVVRKSLHNCSDELVTEGECYKKERLLVVNKSINLERKLKALLHECLHYIHPDKSEEAILKKENSEWEGLAPSSLLKLIKALYPNL